MRSLSELTGKYPAEDILKKECFFHPGMSAWAVCSSCRRELCFSCFLDCQRRGVCSECARGFSYVLHSVTSKVRSPAVILILLILLFSVLHVKFAGVGNYFLVDSPKEKELTEREISQMDWLYLNKAVRQKFYGSYLSEKGKDELSKRSYLRARLALEEVLSESMMRFNLSLNDENIEPEVRERLAQLLISIGYCYSGQGESEKAISYLNKSIQVNPGSETEGISHFALARIYEDELKNYPGAISYYRRAQEISARSSDIFGEIIELAGKPVSEKRVTSALRYLAGTYEPSEAQYRVILCYEKLGMKDRVEEEYKLLIERYPFSKWAGEAEKRFSPPEKELMRREAPEEKEKESLEISEFE